jgi:hypothetical protein
MLKVFSAGDLQSQAAGQVPVDHFLPAAAVWAMDHFEYAIALVESELELTPQQSSTCNMIRGLLQFCSNDAIAAAAADTAITQLFGIIGPKLKDPPATHVPYPINVHFARIYISSLFPTGSETPESSCTFAQFTKAASSSVARAVIGIHSLTLSAFFQNVLFKSAAKNPTVDAMQKLTALRASPTESQSDAVEFGFAAWETEVQSKSRESAARVLLDLLANYRLALVRPDLSTEQSVDLIEEVHSLC